MLQRHAHVADQPDLAASVATARRAVRAAPSHSALAPIVWNTLGHTLAARYHRRGRRRDLDAAIEAWRRAVDLSPPRATVRPSYLASLANLGMSLHGLAVHTTNTDHYREATRVFGRAVELGLRISPGEALRAGLAWHAMALDAVPDWPRAATAGDGALRALWTLSAEQLSRSAQETWLRTCVGIAGATALAHAAASGPRAAVTALESGRGLLMDRALPPGRRLRAQHPELFEKYRAAAVALATAQRMAEQPRGSPPTPAQPLDDVLSSAGVSKR